MVSLPAIATEDAAYRLGDALGDLHHRRVGDVLDPGCEPLEVLEQIRRARGSLTFQAQYHQAPVPPGGHVIRREWLRFYDDMPDRFERIVVSWDTASTLNEDSDWSVGTVWGSVGLDFYLLDVWRGKIEVPDLRRLIVQKSGAWGATATIIEDTELGRAILQDLRRTSELRPILIR